MSTYWLHITEPGKRSNSVHSGSGISSSDDPFNETERSVMDTVTLSTGKISRLVDWNVDVLTRILKQVIAKNQIMHAPVEISLNAPGWARDVSDGKTVLDEVKETIALPPFDTKMVHLQEEADQIELEPEIKTQLREFVMNVAAMYHDNPFHNFEHASHVAMSVAVSSRLAQRQKVSEFFSCCFDITEATF